MSNPNLPRRRTVLALVIAWLVASCASPALNLYTLDAPGTAADSAPLSGKPVVIEVRRVAIPDYLDTQDILVRAGNTLNRSQHGRWASRLSLGATHFLAGRLAERRPDALVTDQPQIEPPTYRIFVTINTLDVTTAGVATLEADWLIVPRNPALPTRRARARFSATGPGATDQDVVLLDQAVLRQLADSIDVASLRS
jgi:uncharacterized lipoprotein YmbA